MLGSGAVIDQEEIWSARHPKQSKLRICYDADVYDVPFHLKTSS